MKNPILKYTLLAMLALGCTPVSAALWQWSLTPATNGSADPTINWAVGMAPSAVDPSARAMMARVAEWRDDSSGSLATGGSSTAYTVTTNQSNGSVGICNGGAGPATNGTQVVVTINATNGAAPTLAVDSCTAAPIQLTPGIAVTTGTLISGTPYRLTYLTANSSWVLQGFLNVPSLVPLGAMIDYTLSTAPNSSYILPAGQCISTTTYATYWALLGSPAPGGCGAGTFAVIDMRGRVAAALDNLNGSSASRLTSGAGCGTAFTSVGASCANGVENFTLAANQIPSITSSAVNSITVNTTSSLIQNNSGTAVGVSASAGFTVPSQVSIQAQSTGNNTINVTSNNTGSTAVSKVQPTIAVGKLLRVL
jgi:microcystin-dependent protein